MSIGLTLLALWLLFVLLLPKRGFTQIVERLRQTAQGNRVFLFGQPPQLGGGDLARFVGETVRLVEAGLPIYLLGLWAEAHGNRRRGQGEAGGPWLPPAPKTHSRRPRQYAMPPIAWRREWEASLRREEQELIHTEASTVVLPTGPLPAPSPGLSIRTLGTFQVLHGGEDLAPELLGRPTLCFIWLYLLTHSITRPAVPVHRQLLAEETFPGIDNDQQRARLRHRLHAFQRILPGVIAERIRVEGEFVRFELGGSQLDVASLREAADEWGPGTGLLPEEGIAELEAAANYGGEYLPIWDDLEQQLTRGRGAAGELVRNVRQLVEDLHTRLLLRLAFHHYARRDHGRLIPFLEEVLRRRPDREDAAGLLVSAYRETAQLHRAQQLESAYGSGVARNRKT